MINLLVLAKLEMLYGIISLIILLHLLYRYILRLLKLEASN